MCFRSILFMCNIMFLSFSSASTVKFLPSSSFNLPINFKDGKLPCSKETVVFPETILGSIKLESKTSVSGLILPRDGEIFLDDATIEFGPDKDDLNCTNEGDVFYLERAIVTWWQPDIWSSPKFNAATPDAERVPCFEDIVQFPSDAEFTLTLPDQTQHVAGIKIGADSYTSETFRSVIYGRDRLSKFIFNQFLDTGVVVEQKQCLSRGGCACQQSPMQIDCEAKFCSVPQCVYPIKPIGHCCKICGGVIAFDVDESFDIMTFKQLVESIVESYGADSLVYHIGRLAPNKVQLVVVDKSEYSGTSAEVVNAIDHQMQRHWVQGAKLVDFSGSPLSKAGLGGKIFVSMFFLVVLVMFGIYLYYYKLPQVSDVRFPTLNRNAPAVFSKFQTRTDSVVCLTRMGRSEAPMGRSEGTAFRNPLYDSTRQRQELEDQDLDDNAAEE